MHEFQKRINVKGDIRPVLFGVSKDYNIGAYFSHEVIPTGYEDFNLVLKTRRGNYFVKIFAAYRTRKNCQRYIEIIDQALRHGVQHPKLLNSSQGFLYTIRVRKTIVRLCVMEYVNGKDFYQLRTSPSIREIKFLIEQVSRINRIRLKPSFTYDSWAITNFLKEYAKKKQYLSEKDKVMISTIAKRFSNLLLRRLPHCLVHGDVIKTNVLKSSAGKLYIIDFSVTNYYPRIQELAVLFCSLLFDERDPKNYRRLYNLCLTEYQKHIRLTKYEKESLPLYTQVAHAMHVLQATYEKVKKHNRNKENDYWLKLGRTGLKYSVVW